MLSISCAGPLYNTEQKPLIDVKTVDYNNIGLHNCGFKQL